MAASEVKTIQRLRKLIAKAYRKLMDAPELNMDNYTTEQAAELSGAVCDACCLLEHEARQEEAKQCPEPS